MMAWNDVYTPPADSSAPPPAPEQLPVPYAPSITIRPGEDQPTLGDDQPAPKSVLNTSYKIPPTQDNPEGVEWGAPKGAPETRIREAIKNAYQGTNIITPEWQAYSNAMPGDVGWLNRNIVNPALKFIGGGTAALGAGAQATTGELFNAASRPGSTGRSWTDWLGLEPLSALGRDINLGSEPVLADIGVNAAMRPAPYAPPLGPPGERYAPPPGGPPGGASGGPAGGATAADVARVAAAQAQRGAGVGPSSPTGILGPISPPEGPVITLPQATARRQAWYQTVDANPGAALSADYADVGRQAAIDTLTPKGGFSAAIAGPGDAGVNLAIRLQQDRGNPLTLSDYTRGDQYLTGLIDKEVQRDGSVSQTGRDLQNVQWDFRNHFENAGPGDMVGGQQGFDALDPARKAYQQEQKMGDVTDMIRRATTLTDNPQTALRSFARTYLNGNGARGWTDMEKAALETGAERGVLGTGVRMVGNQIVSPFLGWALGGPIGAMVGKGLAEGGPSVAGAIARARMSGVLPQLGASIPAPPNLLSIPPG